MRTIERAIRWHLGQLPPNERVSCYDVHISGPMLHGDVVEPTMFHTYACLYPAEGLYIAANSGMWPGRGISAADLRKIIADTTISPEKVRDQDRVAEQYVGPGTSDVQRWALACATSVSFQLPVAMYMVGDTQAKGERVVYLRAIAIAPLGLAVAEFKRAAPQINLP
ncbi:MAG TPA: hypothetical protein VJM32_01475 [Candidatus Saccharimonadales bacterium]|nr:hypothetical protein [Candidatus Saccharimonadales bacterium]